ncbi:MAG: hypothetical protein NCW75_11300 [Phycisphaera sp.]|nr:MAG: hypothetical protein NCW75_11300 [Phycisphaera sp.]
MSVLGACLLLAACGVGPDRVSIESIRPTGDQTGGRLSHRPTIVAYRSEGRSHAEILATDLPIEALDPALGFDGLSGQITRVRLFAVPIAGKSSLSSAAANTVIQHAVINDGVLVVYSGSGLLRPSDRPGADTLAGTLDRGTVRMTRASGGVLDPIGTARVDLALTAPLDAPLAALIAARLDQIIEKTAPVRSEGDQTDAAGSESVGEPGP